jgi:UDP-N-acetyl-D-glucosamine dehydrogenase
VTHKDTFVQNIKTRKARIGVIGMGYVGLPLMLEFAAKKFPVMGLDIDEKKIKALKVGQSYIKHIAKDRIAKLVACNRKADVTSDFSKAAECDALIICVPTPLTHHREPDLSYIRNTAYQIAPFIRKGQLISLESTTYPGTTEEVLVPILESTSRLKAGRDFHVAFSPEREDPNNGQFSTATIPKVVGGLNQDSLAMARAMYECIICRTVPVSNCATAEATKLMENIFRCINIALVNELKIVFDAMKIDIWEVVRAASTKPFGFMPFYPGPGLGGHCIPIDPFYLTWKAREFGVATRFIELAGEINTSMPEYVIHRTLLALNDRRKSLKGARVLLVGLAYKKNVDDDRESPTYALWDLLLKHGAKVSYFDPFCPVVRPSREHSHFAGIKSVAWKDITARKFDLAIISTAHDNVNHDKLAKRLPLVIDARGVCKAARNVIKA